MPAGNNGRLTAFVGEMAALKFYVSGIPHPNSSSIEWFQNTHPIMASANFSADKKALMIPNLQLSDGGQYRLTLVLEVAPNTYGIVHAMIFLNVIGELGMTCKREIANIRFTCMYRCR